MTEKQPQHKVGNQGGLVSDFELLHPKLVQKIGWPAELEPGMTLPSVRLCGNAAKQVKVRSSLILAKTGMTVQAFEEQLLEPGQERVFALPGTAERPGVYHWEFRFECGEAVEYDAFWFSVLDPASLQAEQSRIAFLGADGRMEYVPDYKGNRILDFSNCGYEGGGVPLPQVGTVDELWPQAEGDDTARIQEAIDRVSALPLGPDGHRGALLLRRGEYRIAGTLRIAASGVVLRGEGDGKDGTILRGTGAVSRDLLRVEGAADPVVQQDTVAVILDSYVPSGSRSFHVQGGHSFRVGDPVFVVREGNAAWIREIGMDTIAQRPGVGGTKQWEPFALDFDRVVTAVEGDLVTVDAPIANAIERRWGGGRLVRYEDAGRIEQVGVEHLRVLSDYDPSVTDTRKDSQRLEQTYASDEVHVQRFVVLNRLKNGWVRGVSGYHLVRTLVTVDRRAKWVTVEDCRVRDMVSIITGGRRYPFSVDGQLTLIQRCDTETARHAFAFGSRVCGPNVFKDCESRIDFSSSEPHHRWSVGGLYDQVRGVIYIRDRGWMGSGHGWAGAQYVTWNTEGELTCQQPPTAQNYAIGHVGTKTPPFLPNEHDLRPRWDGYWDPAPGHVRPASLYEQQLKERLGR